MRNKGIRVGNREAVLFRAMKTKSKRRSSLDMTQKKVTETKDVWRKEEELAGPFGYGVSIRVAYSVSSGV